MTDTPPYPSLPVPRPSGDGSDPRETALCALAARPAPDMPPGPAGVLTDRVLVHASADAGQKLLDVLPAQASGLVLRGAKAKTLVAQLKGNFDGVLLIDPEKYAVAAATPDAPFVLPEEGLFGTTLDDVLQDQRTYGATVILTPTGYFRAGDSDALKAAARIIAALDRDDVVFSVPIDIAWLHNDHISQLIAVLAGVDTPKALFLGAQFDPLDRYKTAPSNLRRLVAEAGHVAVFRTDLTGFDALTHGAFATSIGTGGSLRHIVPIGQSPRSSDRTDRSPSVLFTDLMAFYRGTTLAKRFANTLAPACECTACDGRRLDTFLGKEDSAAAHAHGIRTWSEWITDMLDQPTLADRANWWRNRSKAAVAYYDHVNAHLDQPGAFKAPEPLKAWAELPAWHSSTEPASRRTRTR